MIYCAMLFNETKTIMQNQVVNISNWNKLSNVQNHKYDFFFDKLGI